MSELRPTPEMAEAIYEYLRSSRPFCKWKLPEADDLGFKIKPLKDRFGHFQGVNIPGVFPDILVSDTQVITSLGLMEVMAHEMIHLYQDLRGTYPRRGSEHNAEFKRLADVVCRIHGFNPYTFI